MYCMWVMLYTWMNVIRISMHACVCVSYTHLECLHVCCGCVLILTEGLLTAAVYDGLSCRLFLRLSRLCLLCSDVQTSTASRNRDSLSLSLPSVLRGNTQRHSFRRHQSSSSQLSAYAVDWLISQATQEKALIRSYRSLIHTIAPQLLAKGLWVVYAYAALAMCACARSLQKLSGNFSGSGGGWVVICMRVWKYTACPKGYPEGKLPKIVILFELHFKLLSHVFC